MLGMHDHENSWSLMLLALLIVQVSVDTLPDGSWHVQVFFTPTVPHCHLATLIGMFSAAKAAAQLHCSVESVAVLRGGCRRVCGVESACSADVLSSSSFSCGSPAEHAGTMAMHGFASEAERQALLRYFPSHMQGSASVWN